MFKSYVWLRFAALRSVNAYRRGPSRGSFERFSSILTNRIDTDAHEFV
jgi:hypothetical protein